MKSWDMHFLGLAEYWSRRSKDPSTKCGAVLVSPDRLEVISGYNGLPRQLSDHPSIYADRELKLRRVIHAEMNALLLARRALDGFTLYTWPPGFGPSCDRCTAHVIQAGVSRVVHVGADGGFPSRWRESAEAGLEMYMEAGVQVHAYSRDDLPAELWARV